MRLEELREWKNDVPAGLVVFLVAIPLCLGIALASGAPPLSGIIAGFVGGIVVTLLSDSAVGVSGPAAGLVAIVYVAIKELGFDGFLCALVLAGMIQVILGCVKAGTIGYYFPTAVIKGMLAAIGLIIILKQIPHAVGYDKDYEGDLAFFQKDGFNTFTEIGHAFKLITPGAVVISLVSMGILILWERPFIKKLKSTKIIQGPLVAVITGMLLNILFRGSGKLALESEHLVDLPTEGLSTQFRLPDFQQFADPEKLWPICLTALTLAIVASIESLLCAEATDKLDPQRRSTNLNRELRAQGVGNFVSAMLGGLPVTQVIVRSSTNIQSGARTRVAALVHGIMLLACVATVPNVLNAIPLASLAAVLLVIGYKLAHPSKFKEMFALGWTQFLPFMITIVAILFTDLLTGIGIGLAGSIGFILHNSYVRGYWLTNDRPNHYRMTLAERVFFMNKGRIHAELKAISPGSELVIDASDTVYIDQDVLDLFDDFQTQATFKNIKVTFVELGTDVTFLPARIRNKDDSESITAVAS